MLLPDNNFVKDLIPHSGINFYTARRNQPNSKEEK
jgi:hypothetical protein